MSFSSFSFGPGFGNGDIFIPGSTSNPNANPFSLPPAGTWDGGIWGSSGNPTPQPGGGGPSNPDGSWLSKLLPWAQLGAQTFLADQAITSPRPSTITYLPNGQLAVSGGGAPSPALNLGGLSLGSIPAVVWIGVVILFAFMFLHRR